MKNSLNAQINEKNVLHFLLKSDYFWKEKSLKNSPKIGSANRGSYYLRPLDYLPDFPIGSPAWWSSSSNFFSCGGLVVWWFGGRREAASSRKTSYHKKLYVAKLYITKILYHKNFISWHLTSQKLSITFQIFWSLRLELLLLFIDWFRTEHCIP